MAWNLISSVSVLGSVNGGTSSPINTTGADLLVLVMYVSELGGPTDSQTNTWSTAIQVAQPRFDSAIFFVHNPSTSAAHTFTVPFSFCSAQVTAWSGSASGTILDQTNSGTSAASATTIQPGSVTPTQGNELIITGYGIDDPAGAPISINSSFTISGTSDDNPGVTFGTSLAYLIQTSAAAVNPTWTRSTSAANGDGATIATFKGAAASFSPFWANRSSLTFDGQPS